MHEPINRAARRLDRGKRRSTEPIPKIIRGISTDFGMRHVRSVAVIRLLVAGWLVILGCVFCALGHWYWWGALLFVPAGVNGWLAFQMPRWNGALDALKNGPRVRELERSRALIVVDADARLRRIEQDLHDGAQAQMVAVVMKLGLAKERLEGAANRSGPGELLRAIELVDAAHQGAMQAIAELRDLARGIHPPALGEGLGAALATLATRSTVPVELVVELPERPSAAIEAIAYFCVAELLTNIAKHSGARNASVEVTHQPGLVELRISDDGRGGARIREGGGLAGLTERVKTVDGRLQLSSPSGGPTVVTIQLPSHA